MANLFFDFEAFRANGGTQVDLDAFAVQIAFGACLDLATPDPEFLGFTAEDADQLPGRPMEGKLKIATIFRHLELLVTEVQRNSPPDENSIIARLYRRRAISDEWRRLLPKHPVHGGEIFDELKRTRAAVLGPNVGRFLYENQHLIPIELRGQVFLMFWGKIYRNRRGERCVRCLVWRRDRWVGTYERIDYRYWYISHSAVVLARQP